MIWAPDLDDFSGKFCNQGPYPLVKTVVNLIRTGIIVPIEIPTVPTSTTTTTTTTTATTTTTITTTTAFSVVLPPVHRK
jgi:chitinase